MSEEKLKAYQVVKCLKSVIFTNNTKHIKGKKYVIHPDCVAYYNVFRKDYVLV